MKMWKKLLASVVTVVMLFTLLVGNVCAAEEYTYTVTFYAGNHGTFQDGSDKTVVTGLKYGDTVKFDQSKVNLAANSKYYIQGARLSGRDNDDAVGAVFTVNGDADYVVAYGIKGNQVSYTVKYVDEKGKSLIPDDVFYGNVGDKPVVAYKYIDGYAPKALGLTKTLSENAAENVFTFVYVKAPSNTYKEVYVTGEGGVQYVEQIIVVPGGTAATGGTTGGATNVTGGENEGDAAGEAGDGEETTGENAGDVIVDLDDEETPKANIDADGEGIAEALPMAAYVGMGLLALIALIIILFLLKKRKKVVF